MFCNFAINRALPFLQGLFIHVASHISCNSVPSLRKILRVLPTSGMPCRELVIDAFEISFWMAWAVPLARTRCRTP